MMKENTPLILVVDDEERYRELYRQVLETAGFRVSTANSAEQAHENLESSRPAMVVSDVRMPGEDGLSLLRKVRESGRDLPFLLVTAFGEVKDAVEALKLGAVDYLAKPVDLDEMVAAIEDGLGLRERRDAWEVPAEELGEMVVQSPAMRVVVRDAYQVAKTDATILLTGESGVGKEVITQLIHQSSLRSERPLVTLNCGAIAKDLLASELFGHEKGAFTGATTMRRGRFREAHRGTLFLDEIGELPLELQPALLRVVETRRLMPLGGDREINVDYRLIAATNRDLWKEVQEGRFRSDLYYRLNVIAFEIPPLRDRPEDILPLARQFLTRFSGGGRRISAAASRVLESHPWPGNVRELANAMERASLLSRTEIILPENLPPALRPGGGRSRKPSSVSLRPVQTLEETEIRQIKRALDATGNNRTRAAELLGITRRGLIYKLKRLDL